MLNIRNIKKLARAIIATRQDEIGCEECFQKLDQFVEMRLKDKNPGEAMSLVKHHLDMCQDCREEFKALLHALQNP